MIRMAPIRKSVTIDGAEMSLVSKLSSVVTDGDMTSCRTIFEGQDGSMWCMWQGRYRSVTEIDGSSLPKGRRAKTAYAVTGS